MVKCISQCTASFCIRCYHECGFTHTGCSCSFLLAKKTVLHGGFSHQPMWIEKDQSCHVAHQQVSSCVPVAQIASPPVNRISRCSSVPFQWTVHRNDGAALNAFPEIFPIRLWTLPFVPLVVSGLGQANSAMFWENIASWICSHSSLLWFFFLICLIALGNTIQTSLKGWVHQHCDCRAKREWDHSEEK